MASNIGYCFCAISMPGKLNTTTVVLLPPLPAVLEVLNRAARDAVGAPAVQDKLGRLGVRAAASTPAELERLLAGEIRRWGDVIRAAKIEPE